MHLCCYLDVLTSCLHLLEKGLIDGQLFLTNGLLSKALVPIAMCVATIGALLRGGGSLAQDPNSGFPGEFLVASIVYYS